MENLDFSVITYITVFFSGVLASFTPCVYPLIPIVVSVIGIDRSKSRLSGLSLSASYVLGLSITYTILGAIASLTGIFFGKIQTSPVTNIIVGIIIILMGLWMLDVINIPIPVVSTPRFSKKGILAAFTVGFISGFVAAPCTTPVLGTILTLVAARQNILFGTTLLFVFALGMGMLLVIVGTFTGAVIPKSGKWMLIVKKVFAFLMIVLGAYFLFLAGKYS
ncbi:MAG: sulfite exporter TauE/SafE family protein [Elusimicrobia bacterium]|nr:sulfite exporter TauE/SafE family protein [Elusimicrobiota bacterium]